MSSQWQSLVSQKIYLATQLARSARNQASATEQEACVQGAIELALRARQLLLALVARYHQDKQAMPTSLTELSTLIADSPDTEVLGELSRTQDSWWHRLDQLELSQSQPPKQQKTVSEDNVIAVSAAAGPDRSAEGLLDTLAAMKTFVNDLGERHAEW